MRPRDQVQGGDNWPQDTGTGRRPGRVWPTALVCGEEPASSEGEQTDAKPQARRTHGKMHGSLITDGATEVRQIGVQYSDIYVKRTKHRCMERQSALGTYRHRVCSDGLGCCWVGGERGGAGVGWEHGWVDETL